MSALELAPSTATAAAFDRPLLDLVSTGLRVPVLGGALRRYADLDVAATAPALATVAARAAELLPYAGSVHRGAGLPSRWATALLTDARERVAAAVGARAKTDIVVFTRNTTDALGLLATAVPAGAGVVTLDIEHHANLLPWQRRGDHRCVPVAATLDETIARLATELAERPAALLAVTGASNVTGELLPLRELANLAHLYGARIAVDAAQLAPHAAIDLAATGIDYVAFSGHKLYAPFGAGVLAGRRDWLDAAPPYLAGGGAVREVTTAGTDWTVGPERHEGGTPNLVGAVTLADALDELRALPHGVLEAHERDLRERLEAGLTELADVTVHRIWGERETGRIGVVCFTVAGYAPGHVAAYLSAEHGIGVRDGRFCAHPLVARLGLTKAGAVRVSLGAGSRVADVDRLLAALRLLTLAGTVAAYRGDGGRFEPAHDDRAAPVLLGLPAPRPLAPAPCAWAI